jgi:hypothetical protein
MELLLFFIGVYFLPFIIALARRSPQTVAIFFLNLLAGWTLIGWVGAFVWAVIKSPEQVAAKAERFRSLAHRAVFGHGWDGPAATAKYSVIEAEKVHPGWKDLRS